MTNTTAPNGEASQPGAIHFECQEAALGHSIKQSQCVEHSNRSPPNTEIVSGFTPLNPPLSASSVSPVAAAQHYSPTEPGAITFTGSVPRQIHPTGSLLGPAHGGYQQDPRAGGGPQRQEYGQIHSPGHPDSAAHGCTKICSHIIITLSTLTWPGLPYPHNSLAEDRQWKGPRHPSELIKGKGS
jgi:hypothetical protein